MSGKGYFNSNTGTGKTGQSIARPSPAGRRASIMNALPLLVHSHDNICVGVVCDMSPREVGGSADAATRAQQADPRVQPTRVHTGPAGRLTRATHTCSPRGCTRVVRAAQRAESTRPPLTTCGAVLGYGNRAVPDLHAVHQRQVLGRPVRHTLSY